MSNGFRPPAGVQLPVNPFSSAMHHDALCFFERILLPVPNPAGRIVLRHISHSHDPPVTWTRHLLFSMHPAVKPPSQLSPLQIMGSPPRLACLAFPQDVERGGHQVVVSPMQCSCCGWVVVSEFSPRDCCPLLSQNSDEAIRLLEPLPLAHPTMSRRHEYRHPDHTPCILA